VRAVLVNPDAFVADWRRARDGAPQAFSLNLDFFIVGRRCVQYALSSFVVAIIEHDRVAGRFPEDYKFARNWVAFKMKPTESK
jgi:hypothetical protein